MAFSGIRVGHQGTTRSCNSSKHQHYTNFLIIIVVIFFLGPFHSFKISRAKDESVYIIIRLNRNEESSSGPVCVPRVNNPIFDIKLNSICGFRIRFSEGSRPMTSKQLNYFGDSWIAPWSIQSVINALLPAVGDFCFYLIRCHSLKPSLFGINVYTLLLLPKTRGDLIFFGYLNSPVLMVHPKAQGQPGVFASRFSATH